jgi:hypothetical protein
MTSSVIYCAWRKGGGDVPTIAQSVTINGGSNVVDKFIRTPRGVMTEITEDQLAIIEQDGVFQIHKAKGFITVDANLHDVEKVVSGGMESADSSAQLTPNDFGDNGPQPAAAEEVKAPQHKKFKR